MQQQQQLSSGSPLYSAQHPSQPSLPLPNGGQSQLAARKRSASPENGRLDGERPSKIPRSGERPEAEANREVGSSRTPEVASRNASAGVGKAIGYTLPSAAAIRWKQTDLFAVGELRARLEKSAKDYGVTFADDALSYLALAAESRLRSLLQSSIAAQVHRTSTSHLHVPPTSSSGKPMWSYRITSDNNAVMEALARQNKESELGFRASRMNRIAQEQKMEQLKQARERVERGEDADEAGPSMPRVSAAPDAVLGGEPSTPGASSKEKEKTAKKNAKNAAKLAKDMSAEVAHKMSNATAMRQAGIGTKKYSWLTNAPSVSSPLAKKGKKTNVSAAPSENGDTPMKPSIPDEVSAATPAKGKSKLRGSTAVEAPRAHVTPPTRRAVLVESSGPGERRVPDDQALTVMDVMFALERDGLGKGMGTADEVVRKVWNRPGGAWGRNGWMELQR